MKKNSGFIGKEQLPNLSSGNGIHSVYDCYVARKDNKWPKRKVFISCTPNVVNHYEGESKTYTIVVDGFDDGDPIYYTYLSTGGTVNSADFTTDFSGAIIVNASGQAQLTSTLARDADSESDTFVIQIRKDSTSGTVLGTSGTITIPNAQYTLTPSTATPNEGSTVTMTLSGTNTYTGTHYYSIEGTAANSVDLNTALTGSYSFDGSSGTFSIAIRNDYATEGNETFTVRARVNSTSGPIVASSTITIQDTSLTPGCTISPSATSVNEGSSVTFTLNTTNFATGTLTYRVVLSSDMEITDVSSVYGTVSISGSTGSFSITATSDGLTETGQTETFQVQIYNDPDGNGALLATSSTITINDTSTGSTEPTYEIYEKTFMATCNYYDASDNKKTTFMVTNDEFANITVYSDEPYIQSSGTSSPFFTREYIFFKGYWGHFHRFKISDLTKFSASPGGSSYQTNSMAGINTFPSYIAGQNWSGGLVYSGIANTTTTSTLLSSFQNSTAVNDATGITTTVSGYMHGMVGMGTMILCGKGTNQSSSGTTASRILKSVDGGVNFRDVAQLNYSFGGFLAAYPDYNGGEFLWWHSGNMYSSTDGENWTNEGAQSSNSIGSPNYRGWRNPVYNKYTQKFYHTKQTTSNSGSSTIYESTDGRQWTTSGTAQYNGTSKTMNNVVVMPNGDMVGMHQNDRFSEFYRFARSGTSITWNTTNLVNSVAIESPSNFNSTYNGRSVFGPYGAVNGHI